jgi:MFS family permease
LRGISENKADPRKRVESRKWLAAFIAPFAGVLADRRDRVWTIRITQWIGCAQASLLAILVVSDAMTIEILFTLVLMLGIASGVAQPSRLALIPTLVDRESLASALAINSVVFILPPN